MSAFNWKNGTVHDVCFVRCPDIRFFHGECPVSATATTKPAGALLGASLSFQRVFCIKIHNLRVRSQSLHRTTLLAVQPTNHSRAWVARTPPPRFAGHACPQHDPNSAFSGLVRRPHAGQGGGAEVSASRRHAFSDHRTLPPYRLTFSPCTSHRLPIEPLRKISKARQDYGRSPCPA